MPLRVRATRPHTPGYGLSEDVGALKRADCSVGVERGSVAVIVEGVATRLAAADAPAEVGQLYEAKYSSAYPDDSPLFRIAPRVAFGFSEAADEFGGAAKRWIFESE